MDCFASGRLPDVLPATGAICDQQRVRLGSAQGMDEREVRSSLRRVVVSPTFTA
jgi:hypothetical protein